MNEAAVKENEEKCAYAQCIIRQSSMFEMIYKLKLKMMDRDNEDEFELQGRLKLSQGLLSGASQ